MSKTTGTRVDVAVVGGGMAGVSVAHELAQRHSVCLLEMERELAFHATGRSAATWIGSYGPPDVRRLTAASRPFLLDPDLDIPAPVVRPLGCLYIGRDGDQRATEELITETGIRGLDPVEAEALNPVLRKGFTACAAFDEHALEIDVHGLHQGYLRGLRARGGGVLTSAGVRSARRDGDAWVLETAAGEITADVIVNAAGAWGDQVAALFGAAPVGLQPKRRSMFTSPTKASLAGVPMTNAIAGDFYFKPEGDLVMASPEEATPSEPCDARPDELQIARALDAIEEATVLGLRSVRTSWAGLRTFAPSGEPVARFDDDVPGLFWLVGQGGYGIQMAPALAVEAAERVFDRLC